MPENKTPLVVANKVRKYFSAHTGFFGDKRTVHAVEDVDLTIYAREVFGLVGESGCGKSTLGRLLLRLYDITSGSIHFDGRDISKLPERDLRPLRKQMQIIFQDPYASLNPRMTVGNILEEAVNIHSVVSKKEREEYLVSLLQTVGLHADALERYPHEFSGGQRQRIGIARALAVKPNFIVADEPVSALDVSIQAQIINLLRDLQNQFHLTFLFISHDLDLVEFFCDRVAVMYLGRIMELMPAQNLHGRVLHPYSKALIASIPNPNPKMPRQKMALSGEIPSPVAPPSGCVFHTRCPLAIERCKQQVPQLRELEPNHWVACDVI